MELTDLRNKTIFDFTDDSAILRELVSTSDKRAYLKGLTPVGRAFSLLDYAEYVNDTEMVAAVKKEFQEELFGFFNE